MLHTKILIGLAAALVVASAFGYAWFSVNAPPTSAPLEVVRVSSCVRPPGSFLIVADIHGFNDSVNHLHSFPNEPWPVINVKRGDRVNIIVCNEDDSSPHGFAIEHYFDRGIALMPHESYQISFLADQGGSFTMYCNIFCPEHVYMQSGRLAVAD